MPSESSGQRSSFVEGSDTERLVALHLPIAAWLAVGVAYAGGRWCASSVRMDFVCFSGELFIYRVLIALGGMVLTALTLMSFDAIGLDFLPTTGQPMVALSSCKPSRPERVAPPVSRARPPPRSRWRSLR